MPDLDGLPARTRRILELDEAGRQVAEIAREVGTTPDAVRHTIRQVLGRSPSADLAAQTEATTRQRGRRRRGASDETPPAAPAEADGSHAPPGRSRRSLVGGRGGVRRMGIGVLVLLLVVVGAATWQMRSSDSLLTAVPTPPAATGDRSEVEAAARVEVRAKARARARAQARAQAKAVARARSTPAKRAKARARARALARQRAVATPAPQAAPASAPAPAPAPAPVPAPVPAPAPASRPSGPPIAPAGSPEADRRAAIEFGP